MSSSSSKAWLQLLRLPTVFTAMADIFLGYLLTHETIESPLNFGLLLLASSTLYLSGMVFNDVFDRKIDQEERPGRPIPSGRVSVTGAVRLGVILMLAGVGAAQVVGVPSLLIALGLTAFILGYDGGLKRTVLGPAAMGGCRFLNVMLGASAAETVWVLPQVHIAAGLGIYIAGVTWFARTEARESQKTQLTAAMGVVNMGFALQVAYIANVQGRADRMMTLIVFAIIAVSVNLRMSTAISQPTPGNVQACIKVMLLSLVMMDATLLLYASGNTVAAVCTAALVIPSQLLSRWIAMT